MRRQPVQFLRRCYQVEWDLGPHLGGVAEGETAYLLANLEVEADTEVIFGADADWWMKWWVNGEVVYDTLETGNGRKFSCLTHRFPIRLKKGGNLIAVKVVSGEERMFLAAGGPRELRADADLESYLRQDLPITVQVPPGIRPFNHPELLPERNHYVMGGGIARTPGGRLWALWSGGEDGPGEHNLLASSDDDGNHWSPPRFIIQEPATPNGFMRRTCACNLWTDPCGRLWLFMYTTLGYFDGRAGVWAGVCKNPDADRPEWGTPRYLGPGGMFNNPIVLNDGTWLLPTQLYQREYMALGYPLVALGLTPQSAAAARIAIPQTDLPDSGLFRDLDPWRMINFLASNDEGATWTRRGGLRVPERDWDETVIIERLDGEILAFVRTRYGLAESRSSDGGFNWEPSRPSRLPHVNTKPFGMRLASGKLLLVKSGPLTGKVAGRTHLTAYISDDGENWRGGLLLEARDSSHPNGFQAPDGRIYLSHDQGRKNGQILLAVFTEEDVEAGRPVSGRCRLQVPVKQTMRHIKGGTGA